MSSLPHMDEGLLFLLLKAGCNGSKFNKKPWKALTKGSSEHVNGEQVWTDTTLQTIPVRSRELRGKLDLKKKIHLQRSNAK